MAKLSKEVRYRDEAKKSSCTLAGDVRRNYDLYLMAIPGVLYFIIFKYWPMYGVQIAFRQYTSVLGMTNSPWVGIKWFSEFFSSYQFSTLITNTFLISLYSLLVGFPIPILLALLLNSTTSLTFKKTVQLVTYAPHFISTVVLVSMLNVFFGQSFGLVNNVRDMLGFERVLYLGLPQYFRHLYVWSGVWQSMGWNAIIYISALSGVSGELHEAAMVEGANKFQRILHIDVPHILPTATILLIMNSGHLLSVGFDKVYLMQNAQNIRHSQVLSTYVYEMGILKGQQSYSTAIDLFNSVISFVMLIVVNRISRQLGETSLW
ncbi:MAG: sugar ABC transporter permease [Clostridia bacterium]|nr:sugar ABC transporter permease [Clostridia bacterium]